jgi:hypothetical protein
LSAGSGTMGGSWFCFFCRLERVNLRFSLHGAWCTYLENFRRFGRACLNCIDICVAGRNLTSLALF